MYKLIYAQSYRDDVKSSIDYIKHDLQNPIAAKKLNKEIGLKIKKIKQNPLAYPAVIDQYLASKNYRFAIINNYMIFFQLKEKQIEVIRFIYGHRDWINILGNEYKN